MLRKLGRLRPQQLRPGLTLAGFGFLDAAAFTWDPTAGLAAVGLSLLLLDWLLEP